MAYRWERGDGSLCAPHRALFVMALPNEREKLREITCTNTVYRDLPLHDLSFARSVPSAQVEVSSEGDNLPAPNPCPDNTRSPAGSAEREACKAVAGFNHNGAGYGTPVDPCPADSYCPNEALIDTPCPANTFSPAQSSDILSCHAIAGYYGPYGTPATICPKDSYCPAESIAPRVCPPNTQTDGPGSSAATDCTSGHMAQLAHTRSRSGARPPRHHMLRESGRAPPQIPQHFDGASP